MTYSTGSGSYTAMMAAVLAHAVTDGWTTSAGNWPITKGNVGWIDWTSFTQVETDQTIGGDGSSKTQRFLRLGLGTTAGNATANAAASNIQCANFAYTMTEWHIFSEPALNNHIHVVFRFSNGPNSDCYGHFSLGEIDKSGFGYHSVNYVSASLRRGYALNTGSGAFNNNEWHLPARGAYPFSGAVGAQDSGTAGLSIMVRSTSAPCPNGISGWPLHDTVVADGASVWGKVFRLNNANTLTTAFFGGLPGLDFPAWSVQQQVYSGGVTLMPIPFFLMNGTGVSNRMMWLGVFPNVRKCSMSGFNPGDEVTYGSETWKLFPLLRSTPENQFGLAGVVTSGRMGIAYKKVA